MSNDYPVTSWAQTKDHTCGAACLVTALYETGHIDTLSAEQEMAAWDYAHPPLYDGCLPSRLAKYAASKGVGSHLLVDSMRIRSRLKQIPFAMNCAYRYLIIMDRWSRFGLRKSSCNSMTDVLAQVRKRPGCRLLFVIEVEEFDMHYLLLRMRADKLVVMDPSYGENYEYTTERFLDAYRENHAGYYLILHPELMQ